MKTRNKERGADHYGRGQTLEKRTEEACGAAEEDD